MSNPVYTLSWPRALFAWEASQILRTATEKDLRPWTGQLLREGFEDEGVAEHFDADFPDNSTYSGTSSWGVPVTSSPVDPVRTWLEALLVDETRLRPHETPVYFAERHASEFVESGPDTRYTFAEDFIELIDSMAGFGYFPKILPKPCEDDWTEPPDVARELRRATKQTIEWPITQVAAKSLPEATLYSLVEYFNDQAQRPRFAESHNWNQCGYHYSAFNREAGGAVYRWRVNTLLASHNAPLRLGATGEEQGRLIRSFTAPLDYLAAQEITSRVDKPDDEVAHAVRNYRARDAKIADKRAAIVMLYGEMEPKRKAVARKISAGDESALFRIANQFNLRHRDKSQQKDYGEEFLDWVFWTCLATLRLLDDIAKRSEAAEQESAETA